MITILLATALFVTQADVDFTKEGRLARFEPSKTYVVSVERNSPSLKHPYVPPPPVKRPIISIEDLVPVKKEKKIEKIHEVIYFDFDSARIRESEKKKLDGLRFDGGKYTITGYTCDIGSKEYNDRLALRRARAVRDYLKVDAAVEGKGKCCYISKERSKNRRAEVTVEITSSSQNQPLKVQSSSPHQTVPSVEGQNTEKNGSL
jgi:outer membrane protein OmpA-like peptidoglycan-associated protein